MPTPLPSHAGQQRANALGTCYDYPIFAAEN